jgi:hypothetical protein
VDSDGQRKDADPREARKRNAMATANKGRLKLKMLPPQLKELEPRLKPFFAKKVKWD